MAFAILYEPAYPQEETRVAIAADTIIHTLKGNMRASRLAATSEPFYCFTWDGKQITVGKGRLSNPRRVPTLRILLDDGTSVHLSSEQPILGRDGNPLIPSQSPTGASLMPLYLGKTTHGYPTYKQMGDLCKTAVAPSDRRRVRLVARMVYEWRTGKAIETGMIVRYKDGKRTNCEPENMRLEGRPHMKRRQRLLGLQSRKKVKTGNNHKTNGCAPYDEEDVFDIDLSSCSNVGAGGIFLVTNAPAS